MVALARILIRSDTFKNAVKSDAQPATMVAFDSTPI